MRPDRPPSLPRVSAGLLAAAVLTGCGTLRAPDLAAPAAEGDADAAGPGVTDAVLTPRSAYPMLRDDAPSSSTQRVRYQRGEHRGGAGAIHRGRDEGGVVTVRERPPGADGPISVRTTLIDGSGRYVLTRSVEHEEGVVSVFDPPLLIMPANLRARQPVTTEFTIRVYRGEESADGGGEPEHTGAGRQTIELLGAQPLPGDDAQAEPALVVHVVFEAEFGPAKVERRTKRWFRPGAGPVAESFAERVRTFGLGLDAEEGAWIMAE